MVQERVDPHGLKDHQRTKLRNFYMLSDAVTLPSDHCPEYCLRGINGSNLISETGFDLVAHGGVWECHHAQETASCLTY